MSQTSTNASVVAAPLAAAVPVTHRVGFAQMRPTWIYLTEGFRPFFLAASVWAAAAVALWLLILTTGLRLPSRFDPRAWHIHEMLFGFGMAAVAGFLLTAVASWTKRKPVSGLPLAVLAGLWLVGRLTSMVSTFMPAPLVVAMDLSFPILLAAVVGREIVAARNWRNLLLLAPVLLLAAANLLMHLEANGALAPGGSGWRVALAALTILISVIGGRIIPAFTRNWLLARQSTRLPAVAGWVDRMALGSMHAGIVGWAFAPHSPASGALLLIGAALNAWRLGRWRAAATLDEPLLFVLHLGYAWLVVGSALLGLAALDPAVPESAAVHALTAGAMGTMILAVMTRATRGHTGRVLSASASTTALYIFVNCAAIARVAAALAPNWAMQLITVAAGLWVLAFALFVVEYGAMLLAPGR